MWMKHRWFQRLGGGRWERFGLRLWSNLQFSALRSRKDRHVVELLEQIHREDRSLLSAFEQYIIFSLARAQAGRPGVMAEVGVYQGASAKLIAEASGGVPLYLFDTFAGLPKAHEADREVHRENQYACSLEKVQEYLRAYPHLHYFPGLFPASAATVPEQQYSLAHFDVDLYEGTKGCLEYFYPRMIPGGIIVSHDYGLLAGVEQAFREFFVDKPERIIDLPTTQCLVVKL